MKIYFVTYDLNAPEQDYEGVRNAIYRAADYGGISFWQSSYLIKSSLQNAKEVLDFIRDALDENDKVIIFEVTADFATSLSTVEEEKIFKLILGF